MTELTHCQTAALDKIARFLKSDEKKFVLGGYAGTGKSFLAGRVRDMVEGSVAYCAYTGKAALALRERGVKSASTIHRLLYRYYDADDAIEALPHAEKAMHEARGDEYALREIIVDQLNEIIQKGTEGFTHNPESNVSSKKLVIVDEYSMLNDEIIDDLLWRSKKILFLGDPGQLPPIQGKSPLKPDAFLDEVVRQALDNPVLRAATMVREGQDFGFCDWGEFRCIPRRSVSWQLMRDTDQALVPTHKIRKNVISKYRRHLEYSHSVIPLPDEKVVCLQNDHEIEIYNGTVGTVTKCEHGEDGTLQMNVRQGETEFNDLTVYDSFSTDTPPEKWEKRAYHHFDFGYALTVHKAQGSEWDSVVVYDRWDSDARYLYTALTRARKQAVLIR